MNASAIGRNDPCPCGSGKKYKRCCLDQHNDTTSSDDGAADVSETLRAALEGRQFGSQQELQAFINQLTQQRNHRQLDKFHGLSPVQMSHMLYSPFASQETIFFPEVIDDANLAAPILALFQLLADAIGGRGLKATAKGNLPRNFCREAALTYWGGQQYQENTHIRGINREDDFADLHITRIVAGMAGLVRKYKGRFILSRNARELLDKQGLGAIYPKLLKAYAEEFNWGYRDGYPELFFIQNTFAFTLYLLMRYGDTSRLQVFYEDAFLGAFPMVLDEVPAHQLFPPERTARRVYTLRTLKNFAVFLGLATVEPVSDEFMCNEYRVKSLPLLSQAVKFQLPQ